LPGKAMPMKAPRAGYFLLFLLDASGAGFCCCSMPP
jgi:hypothetical protein